MYRDIKAKRQQGFTLVEILIVVIILGILAAIVIPQFSSASEDAKGSSLSSQLQALRSQVALYRLEHNDDYPTDDGTPTGTWDWDKLTKTTNKAGVVGTTADHKFGPYLQSKAVNPYNDQNAVGTGTTKNNSYGFVLDKNGKLFAIGKGTDAAPMWFNEVTGESIAADPDGFTAP